MSETALTVQSISPYGGRAEVKDLADRVLRCLPGAKAVGKDGALATAQVAISLGLNPFIGEIWPIPQKGGGYSLMAGIKGLRRAARQQAERDNGMYSLHFRVARNEEIEGMTINPGDIVRACDVTVSGNRARMHQELTGEIPRFTGIGTYRSGERTRMQPLQVARKRAEADALKLAFDLPLVLAQGEVREPYPKIDDNFVDVTPKPSDVREAIEDLYGDAATMPPTVETEVTEDVPEPEPPAPPMSHQWTAREANDLIAWTRNELVITDAETLKALDVGKISEYLGDYEAAEKAINDYIAAQAAQEPQAQAA